MLAGAHGGLLVSLIQRAAARHCESFSHKRIQPDVLDWKIHLFRPVVAEELAIHIQDVFNSRQTSTVEAKVYQSGKLNLTGLLT